MIIQIFKYMVHNVQCKWFVISIHVDPVITNILYIDFTYLYLFKGMTRVPLLFLNLLQKGDS